MHVRNALPVPCLFEKNEPVYHRALETEQQGAETVGWSRSRNKFSAFVPGSDSKSDTGIHTLIFFLSQYSIIVCSTQKFCAQLLAVAGAGTGAGTGAEKFIFGSATLVFDKNLGKHTLKI